MAVKFLKNSKLQIFQFRFCYLINNSINLTYSLCINSILPHNFFKYVNSVYISTYSNFIYLVI